MEQTKALDALEPFLALSKSATSPRAAADLVMRATSAPNTFLFAELLQTPQIQSLADSPDFAAHLVLLQIFSYGTYQTYRSAGDLPSLSDAQTLKLRQLSLLTLVRDRSNLSYSALQTALNLPSERQLEDLVITAVYAGLLNAALDPARQRVQVFSVAPLRDLQPGSIPDMATALKTWADRCTSTLGNLEDQMAAIRATASARQREKRAADEKLQDLISEDRDKDKQLDPHASKEALARRALNRRAIMDAANKPSDETMDVDEPFAAEVEKKRASKRKM